MSKAKRKLTAIEDQVLTVYYYWFIEGLMGENFSRNLNGLFEMLKEQFPKDTDEALGDAVRKRAADEEIRKMVPRPGALI